jgi:CheY-like chemotaxis protein
MNLAVNARDAMPLGGKLLVETVNADTAQRYVVLTVSDTGQGMDKETLQHLFEPFFTTKEPGKGTGLGLATVHGIVEQSGGHIFVSSEPGIGTSFRIYLPRVDGPAPEERQPAAGLADGGSETILLVEDHDAVRRLAALVLEDRGYRVLAAAGGAEALDVLERSRGAVDLLVTDVVMPGMSSLEMVERARSSHPGLKVLFMSGYTDDAMIHQKIQGIGAPYLEKPFSPGALAAKVREALG